MIITVDNHLDDNNQWYYIKSRSVFARSNAEIRSSELAVADRDLEIIKLTPSKSTAGQYMQAQQKKEKAQRKLGKAFEHIDKVEKEENIQILGVKGRPQTPKKE